MNYFAWSLLSLVVATPLGLACGGTSSNVSQPADCSCSTLAGSVACGDSCTNGNVWVDLSACTKGLDTTSREDALVIADDFLARLPTTFSGVDKASQLSTAASIALSTLAQRPTEDALPQGYRFNEADGTYTTSLAGPVDGSGSVVAHFILARNYPGTRLVSGDPIRPSLFRTESYLVGAEISISGLGATVKYADTGPLVELIGRGPTPPNPFTMNVFEHNEIRFQHLSAIISLEERSLSGTEIHQRAVLEREVDSRDDAWAPVQIGATAKRGGQTLQVTASRLEAPNDTSRAPTVRGDLRFSVVGRAISYVGEATFAGSRVAPRVRISCP